MDERAGMRAVGLAGAAVTALAASSAAAETWDMPMAYAASNFHSATGAAFANCVTTGTGGELEVVTHPSGALFGGADIKRAVQTGQVPIGTWPVWTARLMSAPPKSAPEGWVTTSSSPPVPVVTQLAKAAPVAEWKLLAA